jgi:hypothetical protein
LRISSGLYGITPRCLRPYELNKWPERDITLTAAVKGSSDVGSAHCMTCPLGDLSTVSLNTRRFCVLRPKVKRRVIKKSQIEKVARTLFQVFGNLKIFFLEKLADQGATLRSWTSRKCKDKRKSSALPKYSLSMSPKAWTWSCLCGR